MELITRRAKAASTAARWKSQYNRGRGDAGKFKIYSDLINLGDSPEPSDVDAVIGNATWTACVCTECECAAQSVVRVGEEPDYESSTAWLCKQCVEQALNLFGDSQ